MAFFFENWRKNGPFFGTFWKIVKFGKTVPDMYSNIYELIKVDHEGIVVCNNNKCGVHQLFLIDNDKVSYKDPPKEVCFYSYKRINHFREILAQFQAKESTDIPEDVTNNILLQLIILS